MYKKKILAISGSTRANSSNENILKVIAKEFGDKLKIVIYKEIDKLPHFNPDLDNDNPPEEIRDLRKKIKWADGIIICSPEYIFSLPGSLKNAIDWNVSTTLFSNKPIAFIVAAASGEKAMESLELIFQTIEARISDNTKLVIKGAKGKIDDNGDIIDKVTLDKIRSLIASLIEAVNEENPIPAKYKNI